MGQRKIHTIAYIINYSLVTDALVKENMQHFLELEW